MLSKGDEMRISLRKWVSISLGLIGLLLSVVVIISYAGTAKFIETMKEVDHSHQVLQTIEAVLLQMTNLETGQRGYLLVADDNYLQPYNNSLHRIDQVVRELRRLTSDNSHQQQRLDQMEPLIQEKIGELKETIELRKSGLENALKLVRSNKGKLFMDEIRKIATEMESEERDLLDQRQTQEIQASRTIYVILLTGLLFGLGGLLALYGFSVRRVISPIEETTNVLNSSSSEILASVSQMSAGANETATAVSQTTVTVEEVKQTTQVTSQKAKSVSETAKKATEVAVSGRKSVDVTIQGMNEIKKQMDSIGENIMKLNEQGQAIGEVIATVGDLAEQTNLLSVNAAIEAAKAGEQGRGFAVVAQEVKALAEQSKQSTIRVRTLLNEIQKATGAVVMSAEQGNKVVEAGMRQALASGEAIRTLSDSISEAAQAVIQIAASGQQQTIGIDQVAMAMENIKQATSQNVAGTKQVEIATLNLTKLSSNLKDLLAD